MNRLKRGTKVERLRISNNERYFIKADGTPFSWLADTAWTMPQRLKWDDAEYYMKKRKSQGFTVLQVVALDPERDREMRNPSGEKALLKDSPLTPNEQYFRYLDKIVKMAEELDMYILLLPAWGELIVGHNWAGEFSSKLITHENAYLYGKWIGKRYQNNKNILWCLGGDRQPIHLGVNYKNVWRCMAEGIAKGVTGKDIKYNEPDPLWKKLLITYHTCHEAETGECSTMSYWSDEDAWISYIMLQSGHGLEPKNYELVTKEYTRKKVMPVWDGEPAYEMMPTSWPVIESFHKAWMVRKRAYWSLFAGAFGYTYGHCAVWQFISEKERNQMCKSTWHEALASEGAEQMKYLRMLMDSMQVMKCRPCQDILSEKSDDIMDEHLQACAGEQGCYYCIYFPSGGSAALSMSRSMQDKAYLWWFNPRDGKFYQSEGSVTESAQEYSIKNSILQVAAPTSGSEQDWILIIMDKETAKPVKERSYYDADTQAAMKKTFEWT
jgi:hypothetical protein